MRRKTFSDHGRNGRKVEKRALQINPTINWNRRQVLEPRGGSPGRMAAGNSRAEQFAAPGVLWKANC